MEKKLGGVLEELVSVNRNFLTEIREEVSGLRQEVNQVITSSSVLRERLDNRASDIDRFEKRVTSDLDKIDARFTSYQDRHDKTVVELQSRLMKLENAQAKMFGAASILGAVIGFAASLLKSVLM
jgi:predicted nuclease with TOPRIM domain